MNTASRMESNGLPFRIHLSQASQQVLVHRNIDRDTETKRIQNPPLILLLNVVFTPSSPALLKKAVHKTFFFLRTHTCK